ncbi:MAG: hypothetical protein A4E69_01678 [Syntrophus sp. PtaB.Bin138]|nr:MAG: hypothetical protein A4E69_01678 [Syntrophus sp. PtaB.Bin138]
MIRLMKQTPTPMESDAASSRSPVIRYRIKPDASNTVIRMIARKVESFGFIFGTSLIIRMPNISRIASSIPGSQYGRVKKDLSKMFSRSCAWTSTPGILSPREFVTISTSPCPVRAIKTSFRSINSGLARPDITSAAETYRSDRKGVKWTHTSPSGWVGISISPRRTLPMPREPTSTEIAGRPSATRNISSESVGARTSPTRLTSGTRLTIPFSRFPLSSA